MYILQVHNKETTAPGEDSVPLNNGKRDNSEVLISKPDPAEPKSKLDETKLVTVPEVVPCTPPCSQPPQPEPSDVPCTPPSSQPPQPEPSDTQHLPTDSEWERAKLLC